MIDKDKLEVVLNKTKDDVDYAISISDSLIKQYIEPLDNLMKEINYNIVNVSDVSINTLKKYFLELTNALYFINSNCELFGFYEVISKSNVQLIYNKAFGNTQLEAAATNKKITVVQTQIEAENSSINENIANYIYARSYKLIKTKVDAGYEMVKTLSKVLSAQVSEMNGLNTNKVNSFTEQEEI